MNYLYQKAVQKMYPRGIEEEIRAIKPAMEEKIETDESTHMSVKMEDLDIEGLSESKNSAAQKSIMAELPIMDARSVPPPPPRPSKEYNLPNYR